MLLVIDNYDSFVYNLVQYLGELGARIEVVRNDKMDLYSLKKMRHEKIVISPGPGAPENAGVCVEVIRHFSGEIPILGICLGHQCIGAAYGAKVKHGRKPVHGKTSIIYHEGIGILQGLPRRFKAARYHSLILEKDSMPGELVVTAHSDDGVVMAVQHVEYPTFGLQFHPESVASQYGMEILQNFLRI
ncbi:MAG: aminodeoxychorismate/anthranilate synthase component II [Bacillota bacterium]|nr:aminodeoxychorismate/anthranilate synthase component II [Bacillota bacterium]